MINADLIYDTGDSQSFPIKGKMESKKIYSIPLNELKFNLKNGRIASYITEYQETNDELPEDYNDIIEEFIVQSHEQSFRKTKENIKRFGQIEPAVALSDGTLVDGNRRFSALRQLSREGAGNQFGYIKAIILKQNSFTSKEIKTFELNLQHGREERVDYNPIEYLIDIYRDLLAPDHEFTPEEYARETNKTVSIVNKDMRIAQLLVEYLEFINRPLQFHVARKSKLDGPLREIDKILRSKKVSQDNIPEIKDYLFTNLLALDGDVTRDIRDLKPVIEDNDKFEEAYENLEPAMDEIYDALHEQESDSEDETKNNMVIEIPEKTKREIKTATKDVIDTEKIKTAQYKPVEIIKKSLRSLEEVDIESVKRMSEVEKQEFVNYLYTMESLINDMKGEIGAN